MRLTTGTDAGLPVSHGGLGTRVGTKELLALGIERIERIERNERQEMCPNETFDVPLDQFSSTATGTRQLSANADLALRNSPTALMLKARKPFQLR